jgi:phospholipid transport system substrate-binding protein
MNRHFLLFIYAPLLVVFLIPSPLLAGSAGTPANLVEIFHDALLTSMKSAESVDVRQRFARLSPVIQNTFHTKLMIQVASGSHWRKASKAEQDSLITAFSNLSVATYAAQFDGYSGQQFETIGEKPGPKDDILVQTQIINPGSKNVALTYITREKNGRWQVIDVLVDTGISNLARMRSEYRNILKAGGIAGLLAKLNEKTDALLKN